MNDQQPRCYFPTVATVTAAELKAWCVFQETAGATFYVSNSPRSEWVKWSARQWAGCLHAFTEAPHLWEGYGFQYRPPAADIAAERSREQGGSHV